MLVKNLMQLYWIKQKIFVIQITALRREIDKMSKNLKPFGLISTSRTGAVAMTRGADIFK